MVGPVQRGRQRVGGGVEFRFGGSVKCRGVCGVEWWCVEWWCVEWCVEWCEERCVGTGVESGVIGGVDCGLEWGGVVASSSTWEFGRDYSVDCSVEFGAYIGVKCDLKYDLECSAGSDV
ncbi:hypothetical protein PF011_g9259 [Phytophthora fragariae]|uniref:Uncharacterized protein n=1 Tax=Phytophthora fragariae TaxID=53985 RepID=A0A6A3L1C5_9STRA|nr:hypothetical protein PF011_g9259 [Phytophthora fragariae]